MLKLVRVCRCTIVISKLILEGRYGGVKCLTLTKVGTMVSIGRAAGQVRSILATAPRTLSIVRLSPRMYHDNVAIEIIKSSKIEMSLDY